MKHLIVPDLVNNQQLFLMGPDNSVAEAVAMMVERHIGAVMITQDGRLAGIFTERDVVTRIVHAGRDAATTPLSAVMTPQPETIAPDATAGEALELMVGRGCRHLPVVEQDRIVGMVSIRDLFGAVREQLEQDLKQRDALLFDTGYGVG